jgi:hypothetical protein
MPCSSIICHASASDASMSIECGKVVIATLIVGMCRSAWKSNISSSASLRRARTPPSATQSTLRGAPSNSPTLIQRRNPAYLAHLPALPRL